MTPHTRPTDRRTLLKTLAAAPLAGLALSPATRAEAQAAGLIATSVCSLFPETMEGPFYVDPRLVRRDITEGRAGVPLSLRMQVVEADCAPIRNARVDVWHCDAQGLYSGFNGDDGTFLRGTQASDARGLVSFSTIYPGWYPGRTTHIHFKVFLGREDVMTGQIFFPDDLSAGVFARPEYGGRGARDVMNGEDFIARRAGPGAHATLTRAGAAYDAAIVVGVNAG